MQAFNGFVASRSTIAKVVRMPSGSTTTLAPGSCTACPRYCYQSQCLAGCPSGTAAAYADNHAVCVDLPDPPRDVEAERYNSTALVVRWNPPADSKAVQSYRISYTPYSNEYLQPTTLDVGLPYAPIIFVDKPPRFGRDLQAVLPVAGADAWIIRIFSFDGNHSSQAYSPALLVRMNASPLPVTTRRAGGLTEPGVISPPGSHRHNGLAIAGVASAVLLTGAVLVVLLVRSRQLRRFAVGGRGYEYARAVQVGQSNQLVAAAPSRRLELAWGEDGDDAMDNLPLPAAAPWARQTTVLVGPGVQMFDYDSPSEDEAPDNDDNDDSDDGPDDLDLEAAVTAQALRRRASQPAVAFAAGSADNADNADNADGEAGNGWDAFAEEAGLISLEGGEHADALLSDSVAEDE